MIVLLEDGKYRFYIPHGEHSVYADRHGQKWRDFVGDHAVAALFHEAARYQWIKNHLHCRVLISMKDGEVERYMMRVHGALWGRLHSTYDACVDAAMEGLP